MTMEINKENQIHHNHLKKMARIAGLIYLAFAIFSAFGMVYVPSKLVVEGNALQTVQNIFASETLFRLGIASNLIGQVLFIFLAMQLYTILNSVNKFQARLMVVLVISAVPIMFMLILNQFGVMLISNGAEYFNVFSTEQIHAISLALIDFYNGGVLIIGIFWGLWLLPFGYLVIKSGFIPKVFGILLIVSGLCYLIDSLSFIINPSFRVIISSFITAPLALGEFAMILWLLIVGVKQKESLNN